jgi:hypothetical protein
MEAIMAILVQCSHCARGFQVRDELGGRQVRCQCGETVTVPARSALLRLLDEELDVKLDPTTCTTVRDWVRAAGVSPEVADQMRKKMSVSITGNSNFMMGLTSAIAVLMLIIGLVALWYAK